MNPNHDNDSSGPAAAIAILDAAVRIAYTTFRDIGLTNDATRDAIDAHVLDTIAALNEDRDKSPIDTDDDGGGGVRAR